MNKKEILKLYKETATDFYYYKIKKGGNLIYFYEGKLSGLEFCLNDLGISSEKLEEIRKEKEEEVKDRIYNEEKIGE